ncbi:MAG TPA: mycothiol synthase [Mycobacteriales bacterium]|jgi:mycothiol synthase|nr:mycothiol synthase [Mycobacteriales bacterium]
MAGPQESAPCTGHDVTVEVVHLWSAGAALRWSAARRRLGTREAPDRAARELCAGLDEDAVLHSTSWRHSGQELVLTYALFPSPPRVDGWPVGRELVAGPGALEPSPAQVSGDHVAVHAVRHLADLAADRDPHVLACRRRSPAEWQQLVDHAATVHVRRSPLLITAKDALPGGPGPAGLSDLVAACSRVDDHAPFEEHTLLTLDGSRQVPHTRLEARSGDRLEGCAVLSEGVEGWAVEVAVDPGRRGEGIGGRLLAMAREHVAHHGGGTVRVWAHGARAGRRRLARDAGAVVERRLLVLERSLREVGAEAPPAGVRLRGLDLGSPADRDAWLALSNAAFEGHPDNGGWSRADLDWRLDSPWTAGSRFPVAVDERGMVAGVWTKVEQGDVGELYVVAVHPRAQGQGLGRVVVAAALRALADAGCERAVLYVDAANTAGLGLYRWAGFTAGTEHLCLAVQVPAAGAAPATAPARPARTT